MPGKALRWLALLLAATVAPVQAQLQVLAGVGRADYRAEELDGSGGIFNRESGHLNGDLLGLRWAVDDRALELVWARQAGSLRYDGFTQLRLPLRTRTLLRRERWEALLWQRGTATDALPGLQWLLGGGAAQQQTRRDIQATAISSRLLETLQQTEALLGAELALQGSLAARPLQLRARALWSRPLRQTLDVAPDGAFDPLRLQPRARQGWHWALALAWQAAPSLNLALVHEQTLMRVGASDSQVIWRQGFPIGLVSYPGSTQRLRQWSMQLVAAI